MPAGAVEHDDGVSIFGHMPGDFGQVLGHGLGVGAWHDEGGTDAPGRADGTEDVGRLVARIAHGTGPRAAPCPQARQGSFLTDPGLILEPDLDALAPDAGRERRGDPVGEVFLNVSWRLRPFSDGAGAPTAG